MKKKKRKKILKKHPYSIFESKDGQWRTYVPDETKESHRRMLAAPTRKALEEKLITFYGGNEKKKTSATIRSLFPQWLEYKEAHTTAATSIMRIQTEFEHYYAQDPIIDIPVKKLKKMEVDLWLHQHIKDYSMTKKQFYNFSMILRQILDFAVDLDIIKHNVVRDIRIETKMFRRTRKKPDETQVYSRQEQEALEELAWEEFNARKARTQLCALAVLFQFQTGLRIGELCVVRYEDLIDTGQIRIQRMFRRDTKEIVDHTKTDCGDRIVELTSTAQKIINLARERQKELGVDSDGFIFSVDSGEPLNYWTVDSLIEKYCKKIGINKKSSHKIRKTVISTLIDNQVNINTIRQMVGHSDEKTTYNSYCFDRSTNYERHNKIEKALDPKFRA